MINDFVEYWAAANLLLSSGNPYDPTELLKREQAVGWSMSEPLMMWNPPWTLSFIFPLGWLSYDTAQFVWFVLHALIVLLGARALWQIYGGDPKKLRHAWLSALTFAPVYFALLLGQIGPVMLLGLIAFLYCAQKKYWLLAGACLSLVAVKPHLLYLMWLAFLFWLCREYRWHALTGALLAGAVIFIIPLLWNPAIYFQYLHQLRGVGAVAPLDWATPTVGAAIDVLFESRIVWIRWLPSMACALWFLWYWSRHSSSWNWVLQMPLIIVVSVASTPFAWTFDFVVLLPAVIQCAVWTARDQVLWRRRTVIALHLLLAAALMSAKVIVRNDFWYFWLAPALLLFYLYVRTSAVTEPGES